MSAFLRSPFRQSNAEQNLTTLAGRSSKDVLIAGFAVRKREMEMGEQISSVQLQPTRMWTRNLSTISNDLSGQIALAVQISRHSLNARTDPRFMSFFAPF